MWEKGASARIIWTRMSVGVIHWCSVVGLSFHSVSAAVCIDPTPPCSRNLVTHTLALNLTVGCSHNTHHDTLPSVLPTKRTIASCSNIETNSSLETVTTDMPWSPNCVDAQLYDCFLD